MTHDADKQWKEYKDMDPSEFQQVPYQEMLDSASSWDLPLTVARVVRVFDRELCKVTEKVFSDASKAMTYVQRQTDKGHEVTHYNEQSMFCTTDVYVED